MKKELYRSTTNKEIFGVCGGVAEYLDIDATWIRVGFVFIFIVLIFIAHVRGKIFQ